MTRNEAPVTTNYTLNKGDKAQQKSPAIGTALKRLAPLLTDEKRLVAMAFVAMLITNGAALLGPVIIGHTVDTYIQSRKYTGVITIAASLVAIYLFTLPAI